MGSPGFEPGIPSRGAPAPPDAPGSAPRGPYPRDTPGSFGAGSPCGTRDPFQVVQLVGDDPGEEPPRLQDMPDTGRVLVSDSQGPGAPHHAADPGEGEAGLGPLRDRPRFLRDPRVHEDEGPSRLRLNHGDAEGDPRLRSSYPGSPVVPQGLQEISCEGMEGGREVRDLPSGGAKDCRGRSRVPRTDLEDGKKWHSMVPEMVPGRKKGDYRRIGSKPSFPTFPRSLVIPGSMAQTGQT